MLATSRTFLLLYVTFFFLTLGTVTAQVDVPVATSTPPVDLLAAPPLPEPLVSCFDFYKYGSVNVSVVPSLAQAAAGSSLAIDVTLQNNNAHPIIDAQVYLRVLRITTEKKNTAGGDVVDQFVAKSGIMLPANGSSNFTYTWQVPSTLPPGEYSIAPYVQSAERFNLQGLSFTSDVTGGAPRITVVGDRKGIVRINNETMTLNKEKYQIIGIPPYIEPQEKIVPLSLTVENTTAFPARGTLTFELYAWDGLQKTNLLETKKMDVKLHPNYSTDFTYEINHTAYPIYYVTAQLETDRGTSFANVRYIRIDPESARFNDLGVNSYPLTKDSTAYVCMQELLETAYDKEYRTNGMVELAVTGRGGSPIYATRTYEGYIPWQISALPLPLSSLTETITDFDVTARMFLGDKKIDEVTMTYSCSELGALCPETETKGAALLNNILAYKYVVALTVLLLLIFYFLRRRRHRYNSVPYNETI